LRWHYGLILFIEIVFGLSLFLGFHVAMGLCFMVASVVLVLIRPFWGYLALILLIPFSGISIFSIGGINISTDKIIFLLTYGGWCVHLITDIFSLGSFQRFLVY